MNTHTALTCLFVGMAALAGCEGHIREYEPGSFEDSTPTEIRSSLVAEPVYPLKAGASGSRYLVDQSGAPFYMSGDAAWSLFVQISAEDANTYLDDRRARGFNTVMAELVEHKFASNAPRNFYGQAPFSGAPFTGMNETYFAHVDRVMRAASDRNIMVLLFPAYLGYGCGDEGWCSEVRAATTTQMREYGRYVGNRYKNFNNLIWVLGGDVNTPDDVKPKVKALLEGIQAADTRHLVTAHNGPQTLASDTWPVSSNPWLLPNNVYSDSRPYVLSKRAYESTPTLPFFTIEALYENEHGMTAQALRAQAYWTVLSGGFGMVFGNCPIWHFGSNASWCGTTNWKGNLGSAGAAGMTQAKRLFTSRAWHLLVPDFTHRVLTGGYGNWGDNNYVTAARASDGSSVIAYLPQNSTVTVDMKWTSGTQAKAWWYKPSSGTATLIGSFNNNGSRQFTPPSSGDWVLVIDNAALNLPAPGDGSGGGTTGGGTTGGGTTGGGTTGGGGTMGGGGSAPAITTPASATPSTVTATQSALRVVASDDAGEGSLTYTWSAGSPPAPVIFAPNGTNAAKNTTATFDRAGSYLLQVTVRDAQGLTAQSTVTVNVNQTLTRVSVTPATATVPAGGTQQFSASGFDQFDDAVPSSGFSWSVSGGGTITSAGSFQAGATPGGPFSVRATSGSVSGTASVTVGAAPPASSNVTVDFETYADGTVLQTQGGITWGSSPRWLVWDGSPYGPYTRVAYVDSSSRSEVTASFTLPAGKVFKSLRMRTAGATATIKLSSPNNPERVYTINGSYQTFTLGWTVAAPNVTVKVTCPSEWGASDPSFDNLVYGDP